MSSSIAKWSVRGFHTQHWWNQTYILIESLHHRAASAVSAAANSKSNAARNNSLLRTAERDAASMKRERVSWGGALAGLTRASIAVTQGDSEAAVRLFRSAETALAAADMRLYAAAARRRRGELIQGDKGTAFSEGG